MPFFTGGGAAAGTSSTALIVKEDDSVVVTACTTMDFTEPLVTLVTESPAGEANINMALYLLASGTRTVTGILSSVHAANIAIQHQHSGDAGQRMILSEDALSFGPGSAGLDVFIQRSAAGILDLFGSLNILSGGKIIIRDSNDTNQFTLTAGNMANDVDYTWPSTVPVDNNIMKTSAAGVMAWTNLIGAKGGFTSGSVIFANSSGDLGQDNANFFWDDTNNFFGIGTTAPAVRQHNKETISKAGGTTDADGIAATFRLEPIYTRSSGITTYTITRHNYLELLNIPASAGVAVTDACLFRTDAAAGTHKMVDAGTTKVSIGVVSRWVKYNDNGTVIFIPGYTSKTS